MEKRDERAAMSKWEKARMYFYQACIGIDIIGVSFITLGLIMELMNS